MEKYKIENLKDIREDFSDADKDGKIFCYFVIVIPISCNGASEGAQRNVNSVASCPPPSPPHTHTWRSKYVHRQSSVSFSYPPSILFINALG